MNMKLKKILSKNLKKNRKNNVFNDLQSITKLL